jgi:cell division protein FtsL
LNYNGFISLNTQAIIELNRKVENQTLSDESLKVNVVDLENSLAKILELRGVTYDWNNAAIDSLQLDHNTHIGFIAQEVHQVDSLLTYTDDLEFLHVDYAKVVPILVEATQEMNEIIENHSSTITNLENTIAQQQNEINDLNARLTTLENCLSGILPFLCQLNHSMIAPTQEEVQEQLGSHIHVELNNIKAIVLDQNVPNPFAETTTINYSIPEAVQRAQIHFYDASGNLIKTVDIAERGEGRLNVFAQDLSSGVYTYSLVADGKHIASKRMVKQ